ncbi:MAG TPA: biotin/lipoyl-binding protein, partial [Gammaproteobacteria bacterium]|nr:biotin/lipoyl-binding protein [Gammaproteobacteria bacterium]
MSQHSHLASFHAPAVCGTAVEMPARTLSVAAFAEGFRRASMSFLPVLLTALLLVGCKGGDAPPEAAAQEKESAPIPVEVADLERGDVFAVYTGTASLETDADALVVAKVAGEVVEILAEEGDRVKEGQVLARLDGDRLRLEMERARANLRKLEQEYNRSV